LDGAGADVSNPKRVKIPSFLIDKAIRSAPKIIILFTRDGKPFVRLDGSRSYFGATPDMREILDPKTGQARNITIKDVAEVSRLIDALPNMTWIYTTGWAGYHQGVPGNRTLTYHTSFADRYDTGTLQPICITELIVAPEI
jgi:trimethylamine--corrinoid protein Co-methyltransferase